MGRNASRFCARRNRYCAFRGDDQQGPLFRLYVVAPEAIPIANVKAAIRDDRIGPGLALVLFGRSRWRKAACFAVGVGCGLDKRNFSRSVFTVDVEPAIGIANAADADAPLLPFHVSGSEFGTDQALPIGAVKIAADF